MPGSKREKVHFKETLKLECSTFCQLAVQFSLSLNFDVSRDVQICEFAIRNPSLTLGQAHDSKESKISSTYVFQPENSIQQPFPFHNFNKYLSKNSEIIR